MLEQCTLTGICAVQVTRDAFSDYLKLVRRVLEAAASGFAKLAAAALSGSAAAASAADKQGMKDWGAGSVAEALYTIATDVSRIQGLLPELSPQDRCAVLCCCIDLCACAHIEQT